MISAKNLNYPLMIKEWRTRDVIRQKRYINIVLELKQAGKSRRTVKELLVEVKAINLDYGVKTLFSCAGHVKENLIREDECFELLNLLMIVEENSNEESPDLYEGAGVFIGCMNIPETEAELEKQLKEFNENVLDIIRTYNNVRKSCNF